MGPTDPRTLAHGAIVVNPFFLRLMRIYSSLDELPATMPVFP